MADDLERSLKVVLDTVDVFFVSQKYSMLLYKVNDDGRTPYVSNYFCWGVWPEVLLHYPERNMLAIAQFVVVLLTIFRVQNSPRVKAGQEP